MPQANEGQFPERLPKGSEPKAPVAHQTSPLSRLTGRARWFEALPGSRPGLQPGFNLTAEAPSSQTHAGSIPWESSQSSVAPIRRIDRPWPTAVPEPASSPFPESVSALIHDARNMVSALELYCDLLEEPGVLNHPYRHYARELRRIGGPNRRLLQALSRLDNPETPPLFAARERQSPTDPSRVPSRSARLRARWRPDRAANAPASEWPVSMETDSPCAVPPPLEKAPEASARGPRRPRLAAGEAISDLAAELEANRNLLIAMVGPAVTLGMSISGGVRPVAISSDDLTRVLVNLARNAAEAMPGGGHLQILLEEGAEFLTLSFTDSGPGIPVHALESIFSPGFSTHVGLLSARVSDTSAWPVQHRGLGLSIVRSLVCAAGGAVWAANRTAGTAGFGFTCHGMAETGQAANGSDVPVTGAVFLIEFPLSVPAS